MSGALKREGRPQESVSPNGNERVDACGRIQSKPLVVFEGAVLEMESILVALPLLLALVPVYLFVLFLEKLEKRCKQKEEAEAYARDAETFCDNVSEIELEEIARNVRSSIRRLKKLEVSGHAFYGTVVAASGLSDWYFKLDFDCRGHISTQCCVSQDNEESTIPAICEKRIQEKLRQYNAGNRPERAQKQAEAEPGAKPAGKTAKTRAAFCPYCGKRAGAPNHIYCVACGEKLPLV